MQYKHIPYLEDCELWDKDLELKILPSGNKVDIRKTVIISWYSQKDRLEICAIFSEME